MKLYDLALSLFEIASLAAVLAGLYILLGLGPTLLVGGLVGLTVAAVLDLSTKKQER